MAREEWSKGGVWDPATPAGRAPAGAAVVIAEPEGGMSRWLIPGEVPPAGSEAGRPGVVPSTREGA
jgi:hypothetical protein